MGFSKAKNKIKSKIRKIGTKFKTGEYNDTFYGVLLKANINADLPRSEYVIFTSYDSDINDGELIENSDNENKYIPLRIDAQDLISQDIYRKAYLRQINASGDIKHYLDPSTASKDTWDVPTGTENTDYGWVTKKTSVYVNFEKISLREQINSQVGDIETPEFFMFMPFSVNASHTPIAGDRFVTTSGDEWKMQSVDPYSYELQAYMARVIKDDR